MAPSAKRQTKANQQRLSLGNLTPLYRGNRQQKLGSTPNVQSADQPKLVNENVIHAEGTFTFEALFHFHIESHLSSSIIEEESNNAPQLAQLLTTLQTHQRQRTQQQHKSLETHFHHLLQRAQDSVDQRLTVYGQLVQERYTTLYKQFSQLQKERAVFLDRMQEALNVYLTTCQEAFDGLTENHEKLDQVLLQLHQDLTDLSRKSLLLYSMLDEQYTDQCQQSRQKVTQSVSGIKKRYLQSLQQSRQQAEVLQVQLKALLEEIA